MSQRLRVLLLEDRPSDARLIVAELRAAGFDPDWECVDTEQAFVACLASRWDIILADYSLPQFNALHALRVLREHRVSVPLIIISGTIGEETAVEVMKEGAADYLLKDRLGRLGQAVTQALDQFHLRAVQRRAEDALHERTQVIMLTADVGLALNRVGTLQEMLQQCAEAMVMNVDGALARIWTLNAKKDVLELQASAGLDTRLDGPQSRIAVGSSEIGSIARGGAAHLTNDVQNDPRISDREWAKREDIVAFAGYPLIVEDRLVGVMAAFARHQFRHATLDAMATVANQIAAGIERKAHEEALTFTQFTIDQVATSVFWTDAEGCFFNVNDAACRLTGYARNELLALSVPDVNQAVPRSQWPALWNDLRQRGTVTMEAILRRKDGTEVPISMNSTLLRTDGREYSCTFVQDVTERKRLEEQFRRAQKMEAVGQLAGGVAHDFNNLLTIILGYSGILQESLLEGDPLAELVEQIHTAGTRAVRLTRQLLAFSRKQVLTPIVLDLNALLVDMEKMIGRLIGEDIELAFCPGADLWPVLVDSGQMEQIVMNLVVNSRDAMPQGGKLTIETANVTLDETYAAAHPGARAGDHVVLGVTDTGCGMDRATLARVFEPFFSTKGERGTGLGLATVYGIAKQSGGHVAVYSEPQCGTSFKVYLPRNTECITTQAVSAEPKQRFRGDETVLLVEDDEGVRSFARITLQRQGYHVLEARHGEEALMLCEQYRATIHLLVTDMVMPNMSGRELAERLLLLRPDLKVLYMSGYMDKAIVRQGLLKVEVPFLQKPFSPEALARKVREVLDHTVALEAAGALRLD